MNRGPEGYKQRAFSALLLLTLLALGARLIWELLSPLLPVLGVLLGLALTYWLVLGRR